MKLGKDKVKGLLVKAPMEACWPLRRRSREGLFDHAHRGSSQEDIRLEGSNLIIQFSN